MENVAKTIVQGGVEALGRFYSLYRAIVVQNDDPLAQNRLKVAIPGIQGGTILWALARNQHGSEQTGFKYLAPAIGDIVYVSFEHGDPSKPLWEYHSWSTGQMPKFMDSPQICGFVTPNGIRVLFDDSDGHLDLYLPGEADVYAKKDITLVSDGNVQITSNGDGRVILNVGSNGGMVNIRELTDKLNKLADEVDKLRSKYNSHTHTVAVTVGGVAGTGTAAATTSIIASPISQFNKDDYEDTKCTH